MSLPRVRVLFGRYLAGIRHTLSRREPSAVPSEERERLTRIERRAEPCRRKVTRDDCSDPRYLATAQSVRWCRSWARRARPQATDGGGTSGKPLNRWQPARTPGSGSGREDYRIPQVNGRLTIRTHRRIKPKRIISYTPGKYHWPGCVIISTKAIFTTQNRLPPDRPTRNSALGCKICIRPATSPESPPLRSPFCSAGTRKGRVDCVSWLPDCFERP